MKVLDPIWHPNVRLSDGAICHPFAYPEGGARTNGIFTAKHTLQDIIPCVLELFTEDGIKTGTDDPLNAEAAAMVEKDYDAYCAKAMDMSIEKGNARDRTDEIPEHQKPTPFE